MPESNPDPSSKKKDRTWSVILAIITAVLAVGSGIAIEVYKKSNSSSPPVTESVHKARADSPDKKKPDKTTAIHSSSPAIQQSADTAKTTVIFYSNAFKTKNFPKGIMYSAVDSCIGNAGNRTVKIYFTVKNSLTTDITLGTLFSTNGGPARAIYDNYRHDMLSFTLGDKTQSSKDAPIVHQPLAASNEISGSITFRDIPSTVPELDEVYTPMFVQIGRYKNVANLTIKKIPVKW